MPIELLVFAAAIAASALGGMLGMAGGIFIVPLLVTAIGVDLHTAIGASLVSVIACSCSSASPLFAGRLINIRLAVVLSVATTGGALLGVLLIGKIPTAALELLFAAILIVSAVQMFARRNVGIPAANLDQPPPGIASDLGLHGVAPGPPPTPYLVHNMQAGLGLMAMAGLISALLGIGSGVLKIPAMDSALRLPLRISSATSNFMIGITATASACAWFLRGDLDPSIAGPAALGSVLGALVGARLLVRLSGRWTRLLFVVVLIALAVQMSLTALGVTA